MKEKRNTKQKEILINYLKENSDKHLSICEIRRDLNEKIGLTTIYRIINELILNGKVVKIPFDNKQGFCYQYKTNDNNCKSHYHLICEQCGKLIHFKSNEVSDIIKEAKSNEDFLINNKKIVFYGKCKKCQ